MNDPATPERWLPVPGWDGVYEVSDLGRVRSVDRMTLCRNGRTRRHRGVLLQQGADDYGYLGVVLSRTGHRESRRVHQLVAEAFLGPCPTGQEVRHGEAGLLVNRIDNLSYGTRQENMLDKRRDGTHHMATRTACPLGHVLAPPNLVASQLPLRGCLACSRGRATVRNARNRRGVDLDLRAETDRHYRRIISA